MEGQLTQPDSATPAPEIPFAPSRCADFFVIGGGKCGTTTLHDHLGRHPQLLMSYPKEPCFFSRRELTEDVADWYAQLFADATEGQLCGESSTAYSRWPHTPDVPCRIAAVAPEAKFIYVMRHPAERAYSHYAYHMRDGVTMGFRDSLEAHPEYIDVSRYMMQIERYLRYFDRDAFLFLRFEDLTGAPNQTLERVQSFLGVEAVSLADEGIEKRNPSGADRYLRRKTVRRLRRLPFASKLIEWTPGPIKAGAMSLLSRSKAADRIRDSYELAPMTPEERAFVLAQVREDTARLGAFLDWDVSTWKR